MYPEDEVSDKSERYMICEILREKALMLLNDEIPHGIGVYIQDMKYDEKGVAHIMADIVVEKDSHKPIVIGDGGEKIKMIAERARHDIEKCWTQLCIWKCLSKCVKIGAMTLRQ